MTSQALQTVIEAADRAISAEDFDGLMAFYAEDATLVVQPGMAVTGKARIRKAFVAIADHFNHRLTVRQGPMQVIEGGDTALVVMKTFLDTVDSDGWDLTLVRRASYVFKRSDDGEWLCTVDNSYVRICWILPPPRQENRSEADVPGGGGRMALCKGRRAS
ncbi:nuclear transport factor 2 family protein [uncultured Cohaesibacter sp.]|uniref:YybH family protein n=1 Tax=uncultured Cohaesibacter sp. TaxID=1002546 RepID=UPI0029C6C34B|nr:nuclear transport factor 2 family protein [uncultured Cohaesibacter sp.]